MDEGEPFHLDFSRPVPLFPLEGVTLLPHAVAPFHIFEPRYVQMVTHALDGAGVIAMCVIDRTASAAPNLGTPPIRPAVCVGRIAQHHTMGGGRFNLLLQGVCRARVVEHLPADDATMYRRALLEPIEPEHAIANLEPARTELVELFRSDPMRDLAAAESVAGALGSEDAPTRALIELIAMSVLSDEKVKYRLLEEPDAEQRAGVLLGELHRMRDMLNRAKAQREMHVDQPRGVWLN